MLVVPSKPVDLKTSEDVSVWKLARRFFEIMHVSLRAHETDILYPGAQTHSILPFCLNSGFYPYRNSTVP